MLDRFLLYLSFGCLTRRGFERRAGRLLRARNEDGVRLSAKVESFFESAGFQRYWVHHWRHYWRALGAPTGSIDIGLMARARALKYLRDASAGARVLYVDDAHHYIFYTMSEA